jgi:Rha family phage regulatory protein
VNDLVPQFIKDGTVYQKEGAPFVDSRRVAEVFGKRHADVLRAIDDLISQGAPERNFAFSFYNSDLSSNPGQKYRMCEMDRKGFMLLAMGLIN